MLGEAQLYSLDINFPHSCNYIKKLSINTAIVYIRGMKNALKITLSIALIIAAPIIAFIILISIVEKLNGADNTGEEYRGEILEQKIISRQGTYTYGDKSLRIYTKDKETSFKIFLNEEICEESNIILDSNDYHRPASPYHGKYLWWEDNTLFFYNGDTGDAQEYIFTDQECSLEVVQQESDRAREDIETILETQKSNSDIDKDKYLNNFIGVWQTQGNGITNARLEISDDGTFRVIEDVLPELKEYRLDETMTDPDPIFIAGKWNKKGDQIILESAMAVPIQDRLNGIDDYTLGIDDSDSGQKLVWFNHDILMERSDSPLFDQSVCYMSSMFMDLFFMGEHRIPHDARWSEELGTCMLIAYYVQPNAADWAEEYKSEKKVDLWVYTFSAYDVDNNNEPIIEGRPTYHRTREEYEKGVDIFKEAERVFNLDLQAYIERGFVEYLQHSAAQPNIFTTGGFVGAWGESHDSTLDLHIIFHEDGTFNAWRPLPEIDYKNKADAPTFSGTWEFNHDRTRVFTQTTYNYFLSLDFFVTGDETDGFYLEAGNGEFVLEKQEPYI